MQWEYRSHTIAGEGVFITGGVDHARITRDLNAFGRDGWDLVSAFNTNYASGGTNLLVFLFKRPVSGAPAAPPVHPPVAH